MGLARQTSAELSTQGLEQHCKGPMVGTCLAYLRSCKEAGVAGAEGVGKGSAGDEAGLQGARGDTALENYGLLFRTKWEGIATL